LTAERSSSAEETEAIGARLARGLRPGDLVLVSGELGSGKTTLVRGACRALGVAEPVTSPTFTIGRRHRGRVTISHLDLYRLGDLGGEDPGLLDDYLTPDAIAFVELPAPPGPLDRPVTLRVELTHEGGDRRAVTIRRAPGARPAP
jgi:tRNA threonylcarbamoyladenosine biosynthesis protein TsaE